MKTVYLIRHGMTAGNREKRYIGSTDEPLSPEGVAQIKQLKAAGLPAFHQIFTSPYRRCRETAALLFPGADATAVPDLRECGFGLFEGKTAGELEYSPQYAAWLASGCMASIPGGESVEGFKARCRAAFGQALQEVPEGGRAAFVIHGGCIMAVLEAWALPKRDFYAYHLENGGFVACTFQEGALTIQGGTLCL